MTPRYNLSRTMHILRERDLTAAHEQRKRAVAETIVETTVAAEAIDTTANQIELSASEVSAQIKIFRESGPIY